MAHFNLKKGLDLPLAGTPKDTLHEAQRPERVALLGRDCPGTRPRLLVAEGDAVRRGQAIMADKTHPEILFTSPGGGVVEAIRRGDRRALLSVIIRLDDREAVVPEAATSGRSIDSLSGQEVRAALLSSGGWTGFRRRPFGGIPAADENPQAIFVTAHDTQPLAPSIPVIASRSTMFLDPGLRALRRLFDGPIHFCTGKNWISPLPDLPGLIHTIFSGPHPAGNPGTHIHFLHPVDKNTAVWHLDLQDLLAMGEFFVRGVWPVERIVALGGPGVKMPRLLLTRQGVHLGELLQDELREGSWRVVSGSVLSGHTAADAENYLGRRHQQVSVVQEDMRRSLLGWVNPFPSRLFSLKRIVLGAWFPRRLRSMTTNRNGGERAMVPTTSFEKVMPLDILPAFLLRALLAKDVEEAEALGCLELLEEDLALCTFVCPSKIEYGPVLREMLNQIEKEG